MTVGDDAAAAGLPLVPGTFPANQIDTEINRTRDMVANEKTARTTALTGKVDKPSGGAGVVRLEPGSAHQVGFYTVASAALYFRPEPTTAVYDRKVITQNDLDAALAGLSGYATDAELDSVRDGNLTTGVYNRNITWSRRAAWIGDNGQLGYASSSERYKKNIRPLDVTDEQVAMLSLVTFQWRAAVAADDRREVGLIAERLVEAGLGWAVFTDQDGRPEGINYDMIGLVLLPAVQRLISDRDAILARLDALEGGR